MSSKLYTFTQAFQGETNYFQFTQIGHRRDNPSSTQILLHFYPKEADLDGTPASWFLSV